MFTFSDYEFLVSEWRCGSNLTSDNDVFWNECTQGVSASQSLGFLQNSDVNTRKVNTRFHTLSFTYQLHLTEKFDPALSSIEVSEWTSASKDARLKDVYLLRFVFRAHNPHWSVRYGPSGLRGQTSGFDPSQIMRLILVLTYWTRAVQIPTSHKPGFWNNVNSRRFQSHNKWMCHNDHVRLRAPYSRVFAPSQDCEIFLLLVEAWVQKQTSDNGLLGINGGLTCASSRFKLLAVTLRDGSTEDGLITV
ncbi:hypothetical protein IRJ41_001008, partial [Triplophysa rosa]